MCSCVARAWTHRTLWVGSSWKVFKTATCFGFGRSVRMALTRALLSLFFALAWQAEALVSQSFLSPQAFLKNVVRPSTSDRVSEYERKTQSPMVWLNLKKTELPTAGTAWPSLDYEANQAFAQRTAAKHTSA